MHLGVIYKWRPHEIGFYTSPLPPSVTKLLYKNFLFVWGCHTDSKTFPTLKLDDTCVQTLTNNFCMFLFKECKEYGEKTIRIQYTSSNLLGVMPTEIRTSKCLHASIGLIFGEFLQQENHFLGISFEFFRVFFP